MKKPIAIFAALFALSACEQFKHDWQTAREQVSSDMATIQDNTEGRVMRVAEKVRDQSKRAGLRARKWVMEPIAPEASKIPKPVPDSYCYKVMQDIVCYRQPVQGWSHKLVGHQGPSAPMPPIAQTQPNPGMRIIKNVATDNTAARVENAKPIFVKPPVKVKEDTSKLTLNPDAIEGESLADPLLSPQL